MRRFNVLSPVLAGRIRDVGEVIDGDLIADPDALVDLGVIAPAGDSPDDRSAAIQCAIEALPEDDEHRTADGRPDLRKLREAAGLDDLTGPERDREWAAWQAAHAAS